MLMDGRPSETAEPSFQCGSKRIPVARDERMFSEAEITQAFESKGSRHCSGLLFGNAPELRKVRA
jgi:hypothetical protein